MRFDYHTHHYRCGHARGNMKEYIETAIAQGMTEIGLSDHSPIYHLGNNPHPRPGIAMCQSELPHYVEEMHALRDEYAGRIHVKLGVESDYVLDWDDHYRRLWEAVPVDYVIGSVHWLGAWNIFSKALPPGQSVDEVWRLYMITTQRAAQSRIYDILGHLDALKTSGYWPTNPDWNLIDETVKVIAESGICIELNTSGWRKGIQEQYPAASILERCHHYGVPVTLGSDAHYPHLVAADFNRALRLLADIGYRELATFTGRERTMVPLVLPSEQAS